MLSLSKPKSGFGRSKAQFFILSTLVIVGIIYFVSRWIEPYTIIDTSSVATSEELFMFNNIAGKTTEIVTTSARNSEELKYNLEEYKAFVESFAMRKNINLNFDISHVSYGNPTTGYIDILMSSTKYTASKRIQVSRFFS